MTSGRRALVAAYVREATGLPALYSMAWADACAALIESGWSTASRSLLAWTLDTALVDQAAHVLLGGIPPSPSDLTRRLRRELHDLRPAAELPGWATLGVNLGDETTHAHPTLDLDDAEAADARHWPRDSAPRAGGLMAAKRRRFGNVRTLPSGRYQASYVGPDSQRRTTPDTSRTKTDADRWLASVETDLHRGRLGRRRSRPPTVRQLRPRLAPRQPEDRRPLA